MQILGNTGSLLPKRRPQRHINQLIDRQFTVFLPPDFIQCSLIRLRNDPAPEYPLRKDLLHLPIALPGDRINLPHAQHQYRVHFLVLPERESGKALNILCQEYGCVHPLPLTVLEQGILYHHGLPALKDASRDSLARFQDNFQVIPVPISGRLLPCQKCPPAPNRTGKSGKIKSALPPQRTELHRPFIFFSHQTPRKRTLVMLYCHWSFDMFGRKEAYVPVERLSCAKIDF